ncbi:MAG: hypothetical protein U0736_01925 [Gemmataceae bacterium]
MIDDLARQFEAGPALTSIPLNPVAFAQRPFLLRLTENACRLFSPVL